MLLTMLVKPSCTVEDFNPIERELDFAGDLPFPVEALNFVEVLKLYFISFFC